MGNRASIINSNNKDGVYLQWNGGLDSVEPLLAYCKYLKEHRTELQNENDMKIIETVAKGFIGNNCEYGTYDKIATDGDNGQYIVEDFNIVDRKYLYAEQCVYPGFGIIESLAAMEKMPELDIYKLTTEELNELKKSFTITDKEKFMVILREDKKAFIHIGENLLGDKDVMKIALMQQPFRYKYLPDNIKDDPEVIGVAAALNKYIYEEYQDNKEIKAVADALKYNRDFVLEASKYGIDLKSVPSIYRNDPEVAYNAVKYNGENLKYLYGYDLLFNKDTFSRELCLAAVKNIGRAMEDVPYQFINDGVIVAAAMKNNPDAFEYIGADYKDNKYFAMMAVQKYGLNLEYASDRLQDDKEVVMAAVKQFGSALRFASDRLRDDKEVVLTALESSCAAFEYTSDRLRDDKEVAQKAVNFYGDNLRYVSNRLKDDVDIVKAAIKDNRIMLYYASKRIQDNPSLLEDKPSLDDAIASAKAQAASQNRDTKSNDKDLDM